jgi:hypothetical protein
MEIRNQIVVNNTRFDFSKDAEFLLYVIAYKCDNTNQLVLDPKQIINFKVLNDEDLNVNLENIVKDVLFILNPDYRLVMRKYFSDEGLVEFISETVFANLTKKITNTNAKKIGKLVKPKTMTYKPVEKNKGTNNLVDLK